MSGNPSPATQRIRFPLAAQVVVAVGVGVILGVLQRREPYPLLGFTNDHLGALGMLVIKLLRTLAVPLVMLAILDAFLRTRITAGRLGKLVAICLVNVSVAMTIGLTLMNTWQPGQAWVGKFDEIRQAVETPAKAARGSEDPDSPPPSLELLPNIEYYVPRSILRPLFYNNVISLVLLALLFGAALRRVRAQASGEQLAAVATLERLIHAGYLLFVQMLAWVVAAVPWAVLGIVAQVVGAAGLGVFRVLWVFLAVMLAGLAIHSLVYYPLAAWLVGGKRPRTYLGGGSDAILTGLSTNSSLATVPVTLRCLTEKMGVSDSSARLAACVGTNLNNDGITLYEAMTAVFLAQAMGLSPGLGQQLVIVLAAIMAGAGVAGIPEAGLIVLPLVLTAAGLPEEIIAVAIPLIVPVDWIIARARSGVNVMSDMLVAILLDRGMAVVDATIELGEEVCQHTSPKR